MTLTVYYMGLKYETVAHSVGYRGPEHEIVTRTVCYWRIKRDEGHLLCTNV